LGVDFHLASDTDGKWFKDRNGLTPNQDNYQLTNYIKITHNYENRLPINTFEQFYNFKDNENNNKKRQRNLITAINDAMLLKYFPNNPELEKIYISYDGYKIKYENNQFIIEVLNDEEMANCYNNSRRIRDKFDKFRKNGKHLSKIYHNIFIKFKNYENSHKSSDENIRIASNDLLNYLRNQINPDDTFVVTKGGIRPEVEQRIEEQERIRMEQIRRDNEERIRIREEHRRIREQRNEIYRQEALARQHDRLERTRLRQEELSRSIEEKKAKLILKINVIETQECPICFDELGVTNKAILRCGHQFCSDCIFTHLQKAHGSDCPCCRTEYVVRPLGWLPPREQV